MSTRVLVASASRHGGTDELAHAIASTIAEHGLQVDVRRIEDVDAVAPYDALVLGSAVYMGRWLGAARHFVDLHEGAIITRPTWLFSSGPIGGGAAAEPFDASDLVRRTRAREHQLFGGRLVKRFLALHERAMAGLIRAEDGDYREWPAVTAWATEVARTLTDDQAT